MRLAVIPGDGAGLEVVAATVPILRHAMAARLAQSPRSLDVPTNHTPDLGGHATTSQLGAEVLTKMETR